MGTTNGRTGKANKTNNTANNAGSRRTKSATGTTGSRRTTAANRAGNNRSGSSRTASSGTAGKSRAGYGAQQRASERKRKKTIYRRIKIGVITLAVVMVLILAAVEFGGQTSAVSKTDLIEIYIDGENCSNLTAQKAEELLLKKYAWNMSVTYGEQSMDIENPFEGTIDKVVESAFAEAEWEQKRLDARSFWDKLFGDKKSAAVVIERSLDLPGLEEIAESTAQTVASQWSVPAQDCYITGYDADADVFLFSDAQPGMEIDTEKLKADILEAYQNKAYDAVLTAGGKKTDPAITKESYRVIGSYTTTTTANQDRNTNVQLAAAAVNGQIVGPGEQFSFNTVVGERTAVKGYRPAPAYANGETVQEYGGGVCQVSSTLYNAVIAAGLRTDERTGHSYEPTYVTPGQDATVSYKKPDFVFTNTSSETVGIRTHFQNRTMYVEIFGIPVLEEGVKRYMESKQVSVLDPPEPSYVDDPELAPGEEVVAKNPTNGSVWTTDIVEEKNGEIISREYLHQTRYKGHAAVIHRNPQEAAPAQEE